MTTSKIADYLATWNSVDAAERAGLLARHWAADATYTDPLAAATGWAEINSTIGAVHEQFPEFVFSLVGRPDTHHRQTRFQWGLGPAGEQPVVIGFDVLVVDDGGRIQTVLGFLDQVPAQG